MIETKNAKTLATLSALTPRLAQVTANMMDDLLSREIGAAPLSFS